MCNNIRDDTHMTSLKIVQISRLPTRLSIYVQNSATSLTLDVQFQMNPPFPPLQMITNQLKYNIIQVWLLYVIKSFLQVDFRIHYQLINLVWLFSLFFSFNLSLTICFWWILYSCVCSCPKLSRNVFYLQLFTFLVLILRSTCFVCITWKR